MNNQPEPRNFIAPVTIRIFGNTNTKLTDRAQKAFDEEISAFCLALREDGAIVKTRIEDVMASISFAIDTEDEQTINTLNNFPHYLARKKMTDEESQGMRMRTLVYPEEDFPFWTPDDNEDVLVFGEKGMYVEGVRAIWEATLEAV